MSRGALAWSSRPVGLEYTVGPVAFAFSQWLGLSCGDPVLAREPAKDLFSADPVLGEVDLRRLGVGLSGCELAEAAVGPGCVVAQQVLGQHLGRWCSLTISNRSNCSRRRVPMSLSQMAFAGGACGGWQES